MPVFGFALRRLLVLMLRELMLDPLSLLLLLKDGNKGTISSSFANPFELVPPTFRFGDVLSNHFTRDDSEMPLLLMFWLWLRCCCYIILWLNGRKGERTDRKDVLEAQNSYPECSWATTTTTNARFILTYLLGHSNNNASGVVVDDEACKRLCATLLPRQEYYLDDGSQIWRAPFEMLSSKRIFEVALVGGITIG